MGVQHKGETAVVIGAGMGGLAAAIRLAAMGHAVTVVDSAEAPGGKARAVPTAAGPADTGPTVLTWPHIPQDLFRLCGQDMADHIQITPLPELARHWWPDGSRLDLVPDSAANADAVQDFCGEGAAFRRFDALATRLLQAFDAPILGSSRPSALGAAKAALRQPTLWPALRPGLTLDGLLRQHFRDPRLIQLFGRYATYVGGQPDRVSAVLALIWRVEEAGVFAIASGMAGLAAALAKAAESLGVRFRLATHARRIVTRDGRVEGVDLEGGGHLPCGICVFNGDPEALRLGLLGDGGRQARPKAPPAARSLSAWVWAGAADFRGKPLGHHNVFFTADPAAEWGPIRQGAMPTAPTLYLCAQDRGPMATPPPGPERFEIIMNGPADHAAAPQEDDTCRQRIIHNLALAGLTLTPRPGGALLTPTDLARLYPGSGGAIYGGSPEGAMAAFRRPTARTQVAGLYLAGGGAHPGAGVPMALLSGQHAAEAIWQDRTSRSASRPAAMPGGMSTDSHTTERAPFR